jgi:hypothetical protein
MNSFEETPCAPPLALQAERFTLKAFIITFALHSLNRAMGQPDLYPFILSPAVIEKLGFVHAIIQVD